MVRYFQEERFQKLVINFISLPQLTPRETKHNKRVKIELENPEKGGAR